MTPDAPRPLRDRLAAGETLYGPFAKTHDPFLIEILGRAGFDFVILDREHGPNGIRETLPLVLAAERSGLLPVVRVPRPEAATMQHVLDLGLAGVQVPQVQTEADARGVVEGARFHPLGERGVCRYVRAAGYGMADRAAYFRSQNEVATIIHIEGMEGVRNLDTILAVEGLDVIFVGPYDLSQSLGVPGEVEHPKVLEAVEDIVNRCRHAGKYVGTFVETPERAAAYRDAGVRYLAYGVDVGFFADACRATLAELKG